MDKLKSKALSFVTALLLVFTLLPLLPEGAISADAVDTCTHTMYHVYAKQPSCEEEGNVEYYLCTSCWKYFADEAGTTELTGDSWKLPVKHSMNIVSAVEVTDKKDGCIEHYICKNCNRRFADFEGKKELADGEWIVHSMYHINAKDATCTEEGNVECYLCTNCWKYFADKDGKTELPGNSWKKPMINHTFKKVAAKAATCTETGNKEYWKCSACNKCFIDNAGMNEVEESSMVLPTIKHTFTEVAAKAATCTADGNKHYYSCSVCKKKFMDNMGMSEYEGNSWVIPKKGHDMSKGYAHEPTCTEDGNSEYYVCLNCYKYFSDEAGKNEIEKDSWVIPAKHTLKATKAKAATCTTAGNTAYWTCEKCGKYFSDKDGKKQIKKDSWVIKATGHKWGTPTYVWSKDNKTCTATMVCANDPSHKQTETVKATYKVTTAAKCEAKGVGTYSATFTNTAFSTQTKPVDIAATGHKWGDWRTTKEATTTEEGKKERTCSVCKKTETQTIPKKSETKITINRLAGSGRYETAAKISQAAFDKADTVVLAYGQNYADALAGVSLANKLNAPILLTNKDTLDPATLAEIKRLKATKVIILGGEGAISTKVVDALKANGINEKNIERIADSTRFGTATAIAEKLSENPTDVFFAYYDGFADALSVSPVAAIKNAPVLYLTKDGKLNADTAAYLAKLKEKGCVKNAYVIGGEGVISNDMAAKAAEALGLKTATRLEGKDRFGTCIAVNEKFSDVLNGDKICVATGMDFPDALAGGVYAALNKAPLFLINSKLKTPNLSAEQKAYLKKKTVNNITVFGGEGVVPDSHVEDLANNAK